MESNVRIVLGICTRRMLDEQSQLNAAWMIWGNAQLDTSKPAIMDILCGLIQVTEALYALVPSFGKQE